MKSSDHIYAYEKKCSEHSSEQANSFTDNPARDYPRDGEEGGVISLSGGHHVYILTTP